MTTQEFIEKTYNTTSTRERRCSSVFTDNDGTVYSYGYHYPLAFKVAGLDFVNTAGYSATTGKHITWAWRAVGYNAIGVELWREEARVIAASYSTEVEKLEAIKTALERQEHELRSEMGTKKRTNTHVYAYLTRRYNKVDGYLSRVNETLRTAKHLGGQV